MREIPFVTTERVCSWMTLACDFLSDDVSFTSNGNETVVDMVDSIFRTPIEWEMLLLFRLLKISTPSCNGELFLVQLKMMD